MNSEIRQQVLHLLETYQDRRKKIALLHYELEHPPNISPDDMIGAMSFGHSNGNGTAHSPGHVSNKTLYIALNYQEQADRLNAGVVDEIAKQLVAMEREQERLRYYVSMLEPDEMLTIQYFYFQNRTWHEIAKKINVARRTVYKIKGRAIDHLAKLYEFTEDLK